MFYFCSTAYHRACFPKPALKQTPTPTTTPVSTPTPNLTPTSTPETSIVASQEEKGKVAVTQPEEQQIKEKTSLLAAVGSLVTFGTDNIWVGVIVGLIFFAAVVYMILAYTLIQKERKISRK